MASIIKYVMLSASEAKIIAAPFMNAKAAIRNTDKIYPHLNGPIESKNK